MPIAFQQSARITIIIIYMTVIYKQKYFAT